MSTVTIDVEGADALLANLEKIGQRLPKISERAIENGADEIQYTVKLETPVLSGALSESVVVRPVRGMTNKNGVTYRVTTGGIDGPVGDLFYGFFIHYGYDKNPIYRKGGRIYSVSRRKAKNMARFPMEPNPFVERGFERGRKPAMRAISETLEKQLESFNVTR